MGARLVLGVISLAALGLASGLVLRLFLRSALMTERICDVIELHTHHRRRPVPEGRPIQAIAGNVRRLGAAYNAPAVGRSWVKTEAIRRAYDDALADACRALGIVSALTDLPPGWDQDVERLRVESLLKAAGLLLPEAG